MNKIVWTTIGMCVFAGPVQADDCRNNDGASRNGTLTDTSVLPVCDDNIAKVNSTAQQKSMDGVMQQKIKDTRAIPEIESLATKQRAVK